MKQTEITRAVASTLSGGYHPNTAGFTATVPAAAARPAAVPEA